MSGAGKGSLGGRLPVKETLETMVSCDAYNSPTIGRTWLGSHSVYPRYINISETIQSLDPDIFIIGVAGHQWPKNTRRRWDISQEIEVAGGHRLEDVVEDYALGIGRPLAGQVLHQKRCTR